MTDRAPTFWEVPIPGFRRPARISERGTWIRVVRAAIRRAGVPHLARGGAVELHYQPRAVAESYRYHPAGLVAATRYCVAAAVLVGVFDDDDPRRVIQLDPVIDSPTGEPGSLRLVIARRLPPSPRGRSDAAPRPDAPGVPHSRGIPLCGGHVPRRPPGDG